MACEKKFAVVYFENEKIYSEIPVSWLTSNKKQCWWPNSLNPRSHMVRGDTPNNDDTTWILHDIKFESYASTLESARKKAEEPDYATGNEDFLLGPRQRKPKNYDSSSSCSDNLTPPPTPKISSAEAILPANKPSITIETTEENQQSSIMMEASEIHLTDFATKEDIPVIISKENPTIADLYFEMQQLSISCNMTHKYLISIDKRLKAITLEKGNIEINEGLENLLSTLPCKTTEDVEKFDQNVSIHKEFKRNFVQYIKRMGGKDVKDNINRCLPCLFTNELGTRCSYVGFRGNFKLQDFTFMKLFMEIVMLQHNCTMHEIEKSVSEWFRLSHQRQKREKKTKN